MQFCSHLDDNLEHVEIYHLLEDEMSKYKTLNHEDIRWDKVYEYSLGILKEISMDTKICGYFVLSCMVLNDEKYFQQLNGLFENLAQILQDHPENLGEGAVLLARKKKTKSIIEHFVAESSKANLSISPQTITNLNHTFELLGNILEYRFKKLEVRQEASREQTTESLAKQQAAQVATNMRNTRSLISLNDREYRTFFNNLAFELLENDQDNTNAYALFIEAMWGRIKMLPPHKGYITQIRHPDENLIKILLQNDSDELEHIKCFMSNLILNPFWMEGMKFFCEFLEKQQKKGVANFIRALANNFIMKFSEVSKLKFESGEPMCKEQTFDYFIKQDVGSKQAKQEVIQNQQSIDQSMDKTLSDIDSSYGNSLFGNIHALIEMARIFEEKNMQNNARILYVQLRDLMERVLLKDYLSEEYLKAKTKSEK